MQDRCIHRIIQCLNVSDIFMTIKILDLPNFDCSREEGDGLCDQCGYCSRYPLFAYFNLQICDLFMYHQQNKQIFSYGYSIGPFSFLTPIELNKRCFEKNEVLNLTFPMFQILLVRNYHHFYSSSSLLSQLCQNQQQDQCTVAEGEVCMSLYTDS